MQEDRRQEQRFAVSGLVRGRYPATPFSATVEDVSRSGCRLLPNGRPIPIGSTLLLDLTRDISVAGQAVWVAGHRIGMQFHEPLTDEQVAEVVAQHEFTATGEWLAA